MTCYMAWFLHTDSKTFKTGNYNINLLQSSDHHCDIDLFGFNSLCQNSSFIYQSTHPDSNKPKDNILPKSIYNLKNNTVFDFLPPGRNVKN